MKHKSQIINDLKKLHECIVDDNEQFVSKEQYVFKMRRAYPNISVTDREFEFLKGLINLVMTTKMTSTNTKNYIKSHASSVGDYVRNYNLTVEKEKQLISGSVSANVDYDKNKLFKFFPDNIIESVINHETDMNAYEKMLNNARSEFIKSRDMFNNLALNIPDNVACSTLSDEEFDELISTIAPYAKSQMEYIIKNLTDEQIGYLNYIALGYNLRGKDLERFRRVNCILKGVEPDKKYEEYFDEHGIKKIRIQYDSTHLSKDGIEDEFDIDPENIDFGDITDADVE